MKTKIEYDNGWGSETHSLLCGIAERLYRPLELDPDYAGVRKLDLIICFYVHKRFLEVSKNLF